MTAEDAYAIEKQIEGIAYIAPAVSSSYQLVAAPSNTFHSGYDFPATLAILTTQLALFGIPAG